MLPTEAVLKPALPLPLVEVEAVEGEAGTNPVAAALAVAPRLARNVGSVPGTGSYSPAGSESSVTKVKRQE